MIALERMTALLVLFALAVPASAQKVTLPAEVKVAKGRLAAVLVEWEGDDLAYTASGNLDVFREYDPDPKNVRLRLIGYEDGRGELKVIACKDGKLSPFGVCVVVVGTAPTPVPPGPTPPPPPGPTPPGPVPPKPDPADKLGFITLARTEGLKLPTVVRPVAAQVADNFETVAARLAATAQMTIDQANAELRDRNRATLGDARADWLPWFTAWQALMDKHNAAGRVSKEHYVTAYQETAIGLRAVK